MTASDRVVQVVRDLGPKPCRRAVLDVLAQTRGYRLAQRDVATAEIIGRVERVLGHDGRVCLTLTEAERRPA